MKLFNEIVISDLVCFQSNPLHVNGYSHKNLSHV